ncbi:hypothetical protein GCM10027187_36960 [Streptosporangium sandarakinum]
MADRIEWIAAAAEVGEPSTHLFRQPLRQEVADPPTVAYRVLGGEEELESRSPVMVGRARGVESQDLGPRADPGGRVPKPGIGGVEDRPHRLLVQSPRELKAGDERGSRCDHIAYCANDASRGSTGYQPRRPHHLAGRATAPDGPPGGCPADEHRMR